MAALADHRRAGHPQPDAQPVRAQPGRWREAMPAAIAWTADSAGKGGEAALALPIAQK